MGVLWLAGGYYTKYVTTKAVRKGRSEKSGPRTAVRRERLRMCRPVTRDCAWPSIRHGCWRAELSGLRGCGPRKLHRVQLLSRAARDHRLPQVLRAGVCREQALSAL